MPDVPRKISGTRATFTVPENMPLPRGQLIVEIWDVCELFEELFIGKGSVKVYIGVCVFLTGIWKYSVWCIRKSPSCTGGVEQNWGM